MKTTLNPLLEYRKPKKMSSSKQQAIRAELTVENVGGIDEASAVFSPGITVLEGRNATNRTSFLRALMAALGSDDVSIKGDADEATVELELGDETYSRTLERHGESMTTGGEPYLTNPTTVTLANLFAFLIETNDSRRAVALNEDLRDIVMRPLDTEAIQTDIDRLMDQKKELDEELDQLEALKERLPKLEDDRAQLKRNVQEKRAELETVESKLTTADANLEETREDKAELDKALAELRNVRRTLEDVRYDIDTQQESLESLRQERNDLRGAAEGLPESTGDEIDEIDSEIEHLRAEKRRIDAELAELQRIINFNEGMLEGEESAARTALASDEASGAAITDKLVDDEPVSCWTCGSEVDPGEIRATIDTLRQVNETKVSDLNDVESDLDDLKSRRDELERQKQERGEIDRNLSHIADEIDERERRIAELRDRRDELEAEIEALEEEVDSLETDTHDELLELHKEANQLEFELGRLQSDREDLEEEISDVEERIDEQDEMEAERDEIQSEIEDLRTRIERVETQAINEFNDHMEEVLDLLSYDNLERIWLERVEQEIREGRRTIRRPVFDLHVVRSTATGTTYEDTVDHLSESEREVTGLVFALAGFLAHEVHEHVPFMLLDSLEAIDSERLASLVDWLADYTEYTLVALLPEDAEALDPDYKQIREI